MSTTENCSSLQIRNLVFLGSTGSGKSSTCNTIYQTKSEPFGPFVIGDEETSCTENVAINLSKFKNLNIVDTPGFNNTRFSEEKIDDFLRAVGSVFHEKSERNTRQIDAFILVVKLTPRAQTLRSDLERIKELFGTQAFKSMILLLIYTEENHGVEYGFDFLEKLVKMDEVVKIIKEGRSERLNSDWFSVWDNENPRENQEKELLQKIGKLTPYTHSDFARLNAILRQTKDIKLKDYSERDQTEATYDNISTMEEFDDKIESSSDLLKIKSEQSIDKILRVLEVKHQSYSEELNEALIQNNEMIEKVMDRVEKLEKGAKAIEQRQYFGQLFLDFVCRRRKLKEEEKQELLESTLKKGAKVAAKEGAQHLATRGGQELARAAKDTAKVAAKDAAKRGAKKGIKIFVKKTFCNIF